MVSQDVSAVFRAIADPTRREILDLLRDGSLKVREISERFPVSRPAISKHLRILREAGLVNERRQGRERFYSADLRPLAGVRKWMGTDSGVGTTVAGGSRRPKKAALRPATRSCGSRAKARAKARAKDWRAW